MEAGDAAFGVLCADHHPGYSQPIGGGIEYEGYVSPSGVGYDIGCGNKAVRTELTGRDLDALGGVERVMGEITRRISFGVHFGSRGFGHKTASGFLALSQGLPFDGNAHEGEMDSPPVLFEVGSELGE